MSQALLDSRQAAAILGRSQRTVSRLAEEGKLPWAQRVGGHGIYLFEPDVVLKLKDELERKERG
jgi:Helix-turn-helix domain